MADISNYITPEGFERVRGEYDKLWREERPRVTAEVSAAAELGDRSENAEYQYGKKRLREIDRRIRYLRKRMEDLVVVRPDARHKGSVFFGAVVTVEDEEGDEKRFQVVGADESDADQGRISVTSPVGRALLGKSVDDEVVAQVPRGEVVYVILDIEYPGLE
jgi:transcription elongation factor GreB